MRWAVFVLQGFYFYLMLLLLAVMSLIWNLVALVLHPVYGCGVGSAGRARRDCLWLSDLLDIVDALGAMRLDLKELDRLAAEPGGL